MGLEDYMNIQAYRVMRKLRGKHIINADRTAETTPCPKCGAPAGYFCLGFNGPADVSAMPSRYECARTNGLRSPVRM
jgi:hypothetical protein